MSGEVKLFTALGPGDIVGARRKQLAGTTIHETSIALSEQLFAYRRERKITTLAISSNGRIDRLDDENLSDLTKWIVKMAVRHPDRSRVPSYSDWESRTQKDAAPS